DSHATALNNYALLSVTLKVLDEEASIVGEGTSIILDATENETLTATLKNGELEILGLDSAVLLAGWKVEVTLKCVSSAGYAEKSMSFTIEITELTQMKLIWEISPETTLYYGETATITLKLTDESDAEFTDYDKEITCDTSNVTDYLKISGSGLTWTVTAINVPNGNFTFTFNIPAYNEEYADATLEIIIEKDAKHSISDKTLGISRREITITSDGASKDYDGTPLTCNTYKIELTPDSESEKDLSSALAVIDGVADTESVTITGSRTETGSSDNTISEYLIKQGATDVTHCYNITVEEGTLVINKNKDVLEIVEASGLVCTGEVQDLIVSAVHINPETTDIKGNALTTSTVYYAFEELNANNYTTAGSKTIPTGLHAGTYNVYIYVPESANYNAVGAMVAVKIEQSTTLPEVTNVKLSDVGVVSWDVPSLTTLGQLSIAYTYNLQLFNDEDVQVGETAINISVTSYDVSALMVNKVDTYYAKVQAISSIEGCDIYGVKCVGNSDWSEASNTVTSFSVVFNVGNEKIGGESVGFVGIRNDDNSKTTSLTQNVLPGWLHNALDAQKKNQTNPFKYYYPTEANALFSIYAIANTINGYSTSFDYWLADNATKPTVVTAYFEATPNELILIMDGNASDVVISENENWTVSGTQASKAVNYAAPYGVLPDNTQITRTGYIFGGWFAESSCTTQVDSTTIMNSVVSVTIYAKWTPITYKVKYDGNGGTTSDGKSNISDSRTWTYDVEQTLWPNYFVKSGAKFLGWDKDATVTTATYKANDSVNNLTTTQGEEVVLYAIWASNTYTANIYIQKTAGDQYDTKSSVAISSSVGKVIYGTQDENSTVGNIVDEAIKTGAIVENGIKFAYAKYNGSTIGTATATAVTSGVTFVANSFYSKVGDDYFVLSNQPTDWGTATYYKLQVETGKSIVVVGESTVIDFYFDRVEHTLTLNPNETTIIEVDTTVTAFEANKYYRLNASGEYEKITTVKPSDWGTQDGQGNNVKYYIVITPVFGNTGWTSAEDNAISKNYRYEQIYGVLPQPTKAGYELAGWSTNKDATSADASITANTKMGTSDITLYAVWEPVKYEVSFSAQYNKVDTQILTYEANKYYSFNSSNGAFVLLTSTTAPADWGTATYYIYDSTITNPDSQEVDYGVAYGSMPSVTREGYRFASWNTKPDGSGSTITETTLVSISGDHTVYAMWTAEEYTITFDKNGATGIISSYIVTFGRPYYEAIESSSNEEGLPIIDRAGYEFIGWLIVVNNVETDDYVDIAGTVIVEYAQDHKLKFLWQAKGDILVTADANGGTIPTTAGWTGTGNSADKTVTFGEAYGLLPVPTREGYTFSKWTTIDASSNAKIDVTAETLVSNAENHEITAEWTPNQYTVKYDGNGATSGSTENSSH
ncbi:MAG: InlB B-repeat-containing protein, partial [Clostridia bacterium]|nr:InlB B-repeat-containing protein [Clostridia bacterium]